MTYNDNEMFAIGKEDDFTILTPTSEEKMLAMLLFVLSFFTSIVGPLIIWIIKRGESDYIDYYGKEYFNMLISYFVYGIISGILTIILIGYLMLLALAIGGFVFTIIAAIKAFEGERYQIPFIFRLIK